jgi:excisionase family DNA binding protein
MPTEIQGIKFYTVTEAAKGLQVTTQTVRAWIKQGKLRGQRIGRPILITEENLKEFLAPSTEGQEAVAGKSKKARKEASTS